MPPHYVRKSARISFPYSPSSSIWMYFGRPQHAFWPSSSIRPTIAVRDILRASRTSEGLLGRAGTEREYPEYRSIAWRAIAASKKGSFSLKVDAEEVPVTA